MIHSEQREWILQAVETYERPLMSYATRLLGDVERARDTVQDTFLRLWQADRASVDGHLAKWLYTVCRNRALDVRRKERRMTRLETTNVEAKRTPDKPVGAEVRSDGGGVADAVAKLPERQQEAVRLKFQGGLSYREIAAVMDTTVSNVGVLLHTAIKSMREQLTPAGGAEATR